MDKCKKCIRNNNNGYCMMFKSKQINALTHCKFKYYKEQKDKSK